MQPFDVQLRQGIARADKQVRFGIARGLTKTAQSAAVAVTGELPSIFDRPTPFTQKGVTFRPATRENLTAYVLVRPIQARYLMQEQTGGERTPQPGSPIVIPVGQRTNAYGNIARGALGRVKAKPNVFVSKGQGRTAHLPPGIYQRTKKKGGGLKLLASFKRKAQYKPRLDFGGRVERAVRPILQRNLRTSVAEAFRTAR